MKKLGLVAMALGVVLGVACVSDGTVKEDTAVTASGEGEQKAKRPPETIQKVVRGNFKAFGACYETARAAKPELQGKLVLSFEIAGDGTVPAASVAEESTLRDGGFESCTLDLVKQMKFEPAEGKTTVTYPIDFSPN